jgi:hypothetical protein
MSGACFPGARLVAATGSGNYTFSFKLISIIQEFFLLSCVMMCREVNEFGCKKIQIYILCRSASSKYIECVDERHIDIFSFNIFQRILHFYNP